MVRALLTQWAKACRGNGSVGVCGVMGAQSYRPFGTAAEYTVVPLKQVVQLANGVPLECEMFSSLPVSRAVASRPKELPAHKAILCTPVLDANLNVTLARI